MAKKRVIALIIAAVIILGGVVASSISAIFSTVFSNNGGGDSDTLTENVQHEGSSSKRIAHLKLDGEITDESTGGGLFGGGGYDHELFLKQLDQVKKDDTVKGMLLTVNSPGGGTYPSDEIYQKIQEIKKKGKKVYVQMETMAASGGYYISAPADKIYAGPQSTTGSIGVIMSNIDYSELQEKFGVKENVVKSGAHKDIMSSSRHMTPKEKQIMQSLIDDSFDQFVDKVKQGRHMSEKKVRHLADGRLYSAQQAKKNGLIDEIGYQDKTLKALSKDIGEKKPEVFEYEMGGGLFSSLTSMRSTFKGLQSDIQQLKSVIKNDSKAKPMYMYEG